MDTNDLLGRIDTASVYQPFLEKLNTLVNNLYAKGLRFYAISGLRTFQEQAKLYEVGRSTGNPGHVVTNAKPGQSLHNYGIAVDFCLDTDWDKPGLQPKYEDPAYEILAQEAEAIGLEAGAHWVSLKDQPHIQLPIKAHGITLHDLYSAYQTGGYPHLYQMLDLYEW